MTGKNILIACNKGISSKYVFHTLCDIASAYFDEYKDEYNIYFLSKYAEKKKVLNLFNKEKRTFFFHDIIKFNDCTRNLDYGNAKSWQEIYDSMELNVPKFDKIIEIGSALSDGTNIQNGKINYEKLFNNAGQFKYFSVRDIKEYLLFLYKIAKRDDCEFQHYLIDPQEFNYNDIDKTLNYTRYFQYTSKLLDFKRKDTFLLTYKNTNYKNETLNEIEKTNDFIFGYTVLTRDRKNDLYEFLENELQDYNIKLFLKDKFKQVDTFITKDKYIKLLQQSKFTLIIPAYDKNTFSIYRYIESIYNDCLPLILDDNYLDEVRQSIYIPDEIIISKSQLSEKIKNLDYSGILQKIKDKL